MGCTPGSLFDVSSCTGLDLRHIPRALRDEHGFADTRSWAALLGDPTLARPPHALLFGTAKRFGDFYGVSDRQAREIMKKGHCYSVGGFRVTLVQSAQWLRRQHESDILAARARAGRCSGEARAMANAARGHVTDVSG
jgi:hypothetical protein